MPRMTKEAKEKRYAEIMEKVNREARTVYGECDLCRIKFYAEGEDKKHYDSPEHKNKVEREARYVSAESKGVKFT